jgi:hypothetical protein
LRVFGDRLEEVSRAAEGGDGFLERLGRRLLHRGGDFVALGGEDLLEDGVHAAAVCNTFAGALQSAAHELGGSL